MLIIKYEDLEKHFTRPVVISPFYSSKNFYKVPRKLKKKYRYLFSKANNDLTIQERLWYLLGIENPNYKSFLIKEICKDYI